MKINHSLPATEGVNPELLLNIVNVLDQCCCHSVMILRHDKIICEGWWKPYNPNYPHVLFSLSKSFLSTAVCFAVQEGLLSFEDYIVKFFPEHFPTPPCESMQKVQIKHLLSMSYGRKTSLDPDYYYLKDWLEFSLHPYLYSEPGTQFNYDNRCPFILSVIMQNVTGMTVLDYLKPRFFEPLGIENPFWEQKNGYNIGRGGLNLKTEDIAKFGLFLIHRGLYNGKQLLNANLVDEMTKFQIKAIIEPVDPNPDYNIGYGYFFWMCQPEGAFRGDGACGQFLFVMPKQDIIVAVTAGTTEKAETIMQVLWDNLVDKLDDSKALSNTEVVNKNQKLLEEKLNSLMIPYVSSSYKHLGEVSKYSGKVYNVCHNRPNIVKLSVIFGESSDVLKLWTLGNSAEPSKNPPKEPVLLTLKVGHDEWLENETNFEVENFHAHSTILFSNVACSSKWLSKNEYAVKLVYTQTPYSDTLKIAFNENGINGEYSCDPVMLNRGDSFQIMGLPVNE